MDSRRYTPIQVIYSQTSNTWVNVHDLMYFLEITGTRCTFIWASEELGFRHLYLITSGLSLKTTNQTVAGGDHKLVNGLTKNHVLKMDQGDLSIDHEAENQKLQNGVNNDPLAPRIVNKVALTAGSWEVLGNKIWVDEKHQIVYFQGLRETALEKHLYAVSLQQPGNIRLLSSPGFSYTVQFSDDCTVFMQIYCNIQTLPTCEIVKVTQTNAKGGVNGLSLAPLGYLLQGSPPDNSQYCPTIYTHQLSNGAETLYSMVFKPHNFKLGVKYPTILNVYGTYLL